MERLAQNLFIAANTPAQHAALAAFESETAVILESRRARFQQRRDRLLSAVRALGFSVPQQPAGAFYLYAGLPDAVKEDSMQFAAGLLDQAGVAVTPGWDFGDYGAGRHIRFAYTRELDALDEAAERIAGYLAQSLR